MTPLETHALLAQGAHAWNAWAEALLKERQRLENAGQWHAALDVGPKRIGLNDATANWLDRAACDFSLSAAQHHSAGLSLIFPGAVSFGAALAEGGTFWDCTFHDIVDLDGLYANGHFWFHNCTFKSDILARHSTFENGFRISFSTIKGAADLQDSKFGELVRLDSCIFESEVNLSRSEFAGPVMLSDSRFGLPVDFTGATFALEFPQSSTRFGQQLRFDRRAALMCASR